jgi:hypothetical protein
VLDDQRDLLVAQLRVRGAAAAAAAIAVLGVCVAWFGDKAIGIPAATHDGGGSMPLWHPLSLAGATIPVLASYSTLEDLEVAAAKPLARFRYLYLVASGCLSGIVLILSSLSLDRSPYWLMAESTLGWLGMALISGRVLGLRLSWALPLLACVVIEYFQVPTPLSWWALAETGSVPWRSLLISACVLAAGCLSVWLTPWRLNRLRRYTLRTVALRSSDASG